MLFHSALFLAFLSVLLPLYALARGSEARKWLLLAGSYLFYASWDVRYLPLLLLSTGVDAWEVTFTMPAVWQIDDLPEPMDERVQLVEIPGMRVAARSFSGRAGDREMRTEMMALLVAMQRQGLGQAGAPVFAQYDPPWIPGPARRNEVIIPVRDLDVRRRCDMSVQAHANAAERYVLHLAGVLLVVHEHGQGDR